MYSKLENQRTVKMHSDIFNRQNQQLVSPLLNYPLYGDILVESLKDPQDAQTVQNIFFSVPDVCLCECTMINASNGISMHGCSQNNRIPMEFYQGHFCI